MPKASYTLGGLQGFAADLDHLGIEVVARASVAVETTALNVQRRAQANAPRDRGDLVASIRVEGRGLNWRVGLNDADIPSRGGRNSAHRNPSVYGVWYEYGFKTRHIATHPFMGPARDAEEGPHIDRLIDAVNGALT